MVLLHGVHRHVAHVGARAAGARAPSRRAGADAARARRRSAARRRGRATTRSSTAVEAAMDDAGFDDAPTSSATRSAATSRCTSRRAGARDVRRGARAGGRLGAGDEALRGDARLLRRRCRSRLQAAAPHADAIARHAQGRRRATQFTTVATSTSRPSCSPTRCVGAARLRAVAPADRGAPRDGWRLDAERIDCPVRVVWGTEDRLLPWPRGRRPLPRRLAAARRLGRARRRRPLPAARRPARDGAADPRLHRALASRRGHLGRRRPDRPRAARGDRAASRATCASGA